MQVCKPCHFALIEAVEPFKLHPMSMSYINEVFEHLLRLWMGMRAHIHSVNSTDTSPVLVKLAEILPDASVQTMQLRFDWGHRTFQTASHVHVIHIWGVWASSQVVDGMRANIHIVNSTDTSPDLWDLGEILPDASVQTMPLHFGWGCGSFQTASHNHVIHIWEVWVLSQVVDGHIATRSYHYHHRPQTLPQFW